MVKTKKEVIILVLMLVLIIAVLGVSWAVFNYSALGTKVNTITTGSITMSYEESDYILSMFYDNSFYHRGNIIIEKESFL